MTDITTPAQMRKAVEQAVLAEKMRMMSWCAKRNAVSRKAWEQAARKALAGDIADLRNRIDLIDAEPLDIVLSGADGDALPVAEPEPLAVQVRAEALEEAAKLATSFLVGDPKNGVPLRNPMAHEIADAIRAMKGAMR